MDAIVIGLVNNMPDTALEATETQFSALLQAAAGPLPVQLRFASLPELPRAPAALEHIRRSYYPLDALLQGEPDALIVTGTEPRAQRLSDEPYWGSFERLLAWAEAHTVSSIWSCLAAHAAVQYLDGIQRRRLAEKCCGVFQHEVLSEHALLQGIGSPLSTPHSRWNDLPAGELRAAGYELLSWSDDTGANIFARRGRSLFVFFQGHPEYEDTTLLKEYRRDVGRYLSGQQQHYPTPPHGCFTAEASAALLAFRQRALGSRSAELLSEFPFAALAAGLENTWRAAAVGIYRNWLAGIAAARGRATAALSARTSHAGI